MTRPARLLFVCTANIARSAYAEHRARDLFERDPSLAWEVASAGIPGYPGRPMDPHLAGELTRRGIRTPAHVSRVLDDAALEWADLALTFEMRQHLAILEAWPRRAGKVFGLRQFARAAALAPEAADIGALLHSVVALAEPDSMTLDVDDPYGRGRRAAHACAAEIDGVLRRILPALEAVAGCDASGDSTSDGIS